MTLIGVTTFLLYVGKIDQELFQLVVTNIVAFYFGLNVAEKRVVSQYHEKEGNH